MMRLLTFFMFLIVGEESSPSLEKSGEVAGFSERPHRQEASSGDPPMHGSSPKSSGPGLCFPSYQGSPFLSLLCVSRQA